MDKDGSISKEEIEIALKEKIGDASLTSLVDGLLSNGNDVMKTTIIEIGSEFAKDAGRVIDLFKKWDENGDGAHIEGDARGGMRARGTSHTR